jgi:hypothetical protein
MHTWVGVLGLSLRPPGVSVAAFLGEAQFTPNSSCLDPSIQKQGLSLATLEL